MLVQGGGLSTAAQHVMMLELLHMKHSQSDLCEWVCALKHTCSPPGIRSRLACTLLLWLLPLCHQATPANVHAGPHCPDIHPAGAINLLLSCSSSGSIDAGATHDVLQLPGAHIEGGWVCQDVSLIMCSSLCPAHCPSGVPLSQGSHANTLTMSWEACRVFGRGQAVMSFCDVLWHSSTGQQQMPAKRCCCLQGQEGEAALAELLKEEHAAADQFYWAVRQQVGPMPVLQTAQHTAPGRSVPRAAQQLYGCHLPSALCRLRESRGCYVQPNNTASVLQFMLETTRLARSWSPQQAIPCS